MELKHCQSSHLIHAIRGGVVVKNQNLDSDGKPALVSKSLQEIYKSEDAQTLRRSTFEFQKVKREPVDVCFIADRELVNDSDDETTLKELKNRFTTKKRKIGSRGCKINKGHENEKPVEDDLDLDEPIIKLKSRQSKNTKAKREHINRNVASSFSTAVHNPIHGSSQQFGGEIVPVIWEKVKVEEVEEIACHDTGYATDGSSTGHIEDPSLFSAVSNEVTEIIHHGHSETSWSSDEAHQCIAANEIPDYHLEDIQPICMLAPWNDSNVMFETLDLHCPGVMDSQQLAIKMGNKGMESDVCRSSPSDDQYPDVFSDSGRSFTDEVLCVQNISSGMQVLAIDFPHDQDDSMSRADQNYGSSEDSIMFFKADDILVSEEDTTAEQQGLSSIFNGVENNALTLKSGGYVEDGLLMSKEKPPITKKEKWSCEKNPTFNNDMFSPPEPRQHPERLLSKRKVIDPSSQERLCKAMHSEDMCNEVDQNIIPEYEGNFPDKQNPKKASSPRSGIPTVKINLNHGLGEQLSQRKVIRHTVKKLQNAKGTLDGSRISRSLPKLNTSCTSVQSCSESAIAFSQRQMHDMENLAAKLMNELNSMKDIVEQKLLFESYRNVSLKSDTDEVRSAISSATKVEEAGRKWLNLMSRDCNRFCKIMKLNPQSGGGSKDVRKEGKKIKFADEMGGKLCHVKLFEVNGMSDAIQQEEDHSHST